MIMKKNRMAFSMKMMKAQREYILLSPSEKRGFRIVQDRYGRWMVNGLYFFGEEKTDGNTVNDSSLIQLGWDDDEDEYEYEYDDLDDDDDDDLFDEDDDYDELDDLDDDEDDFDDDYDDLEIDIEEEEDF